MAQVVVLMHNVVLFGLLVEVMHGCSVGCCWCCLW